MSDILDQMEAEKPKTAELKPNIRWEIGEVLGVVIPPNGWNKAFNELSVAGSLDFNTIISVLKVILRRIEENETAK